MISRRLKIQCQRQASEHRHGVQRSAFPLPLRPLPLAPPSGWLRNCGVLGTIAVLSLFAIGGCRSVPELAVDQRPAAYTAEPYAAVLEAAVVDGLVDYAAIVGDVRHQLDRYLYALATYGPETTPDAFPTEAHRHAYHLNAYNALMLRLWLDKGAAEAGPDASVGWLTWFVTERFPLDGGSTTLHHLEQSVIRPTYEEPRDHFALVCGAISCPPLLGEPFAAERLDDQLESLGRRWLNEPDGLTLVDGEPRMSRIFKWYRDDFDLAGMGGLTGVVRRYVRAGNPRREAALKALADDDLDFLGYDWTINSPAAALESGER